MKEHTLYYVYDPMCSWCWGYKPVWQQIKTELEKLVSVQYVVGGLAPDSNQAMSAEMQQQIAAYWTRIEALLGTEFNHDFWLENTPRRSTYPSCRAALAARKQGKEIEMIEGIQQAYYLDAKNPSDDDILLEVAESISLDIDAFERDYRSDSLEHEFQRELEFARSIGGNSFPSLFLTTGKGIIELPIDYQNPQVTIAQVRQLTN
ncbi:hypothetical protein VISI1226_22220 [Vibrio sinaloensis DSM 21326]|uniref:DSBA-like thioredoxin domain-containing protein n=1 Tax=Vibrio sinaloensis DSM 21326 TaxID=945550 RepID=E8M6L4_PHOS4|nr:DsbA family protein [Vibrio sinaloensis]EGA70332.1 hypothetical protein VISI1226_22220 [Vibrio sinaloensis DSM 21326]